MERNSTGGVARPRVVIVGGGFGGLAAARALKDAPVDVVLVDRRNHHLFQPLLYQVATAGLGTNDIAAPIRRVLRKQRNAQVLLAEASSVDVERKLLHLVDGDLAYDFLILAPGAVDSYFGHDEWRPFAPGLKSLEDAVEIRRRMLLAFETAEREGDPARRRELLTFVLVGGGPTGVEMAGSMAEIARYTLATDFRTFDPKSAVIVLVEGRDRILPAYPPELSAKAQRMLERLGVVVRTNAFVTDVREDGVSIGDERIPSRTIVWSAGVRGAPILGTLGAETTRGGQVLVEPDLTVPGRPEVSVIGDAAAVRGEGDEYVPWLAPAALQMGRHAARNVARTLAGKERLPFRYVDKGKLSTIGRGKAVAWFGRVRCAGFLAWLLWLFVHVFFLIGFRNRFVVLFEWATAYVTWQRSARVIVGAPPPRVRPKEHVVAPRRAGEVRQEPAARSHSFEK